MSKKKYLYKFNPYMEHPISVFEVTLTYAFLTKYKEFIVECVTPKGHKFRCSRRWIKLLKITDYLKYDVKR